jgi:hypothetical protein
MTFYKWFQQGRQRVTGKIESVHDLACDNFRSIFACHGSASCSAWQLGDEFCRIPEHDELPTARQGYWIVESPLPTLGRHQANSSAPAGVNFT